MFKGRVSAFLLGSAVCLASLHAQEAKPQRDGPMITASANDQGLTAEELAVNADHLYVAGKYAEALALYRKFIESFGEAKEAQAAIRMMRYPIAMCLFHLKKLPEAVEAIDEALKTEPPLDTSVQQELWFWKGVCLLQDDPEQARAALEKFLTMFPPTAERDFSYIRQFPATEKIPEAKLMIGATYFGQEKFAEGAAYLAKIKPGLIPVNRGRATVLELRCLVEAQDYDSALKLAMQEYPNMGDLVQLITFQTLVLQLGSLYLEKGDYRAAIICLQRIWDSDRLLKHQRASLEDLESRLAAAQANPKGDPYVGFLLNQLIGGVKREIKNFEKIPNFDSALRMRLAYAFQKMERYRECALVLEAMLRDMPPDPVVESASVNVVQCWSVIEDWRKAVEAAQLFVDKFPDSPSVPFVLYLEAGALEKLFHFDASIICYDDILKKYPKSEYAPRALFMQGFTCLLAERYKEGIADFERFQQQYPQHEMADAAAYWHGMGFSLDKQYARCRTVMDEYLAQRKDGAYRAGAAYRKAYCAQQLEDYQTSIRELKAYLKAYPKDTENNAEAKMLLGDALMDQGQVEEGIAVLNSIPGTIADRGLYEEAVFKIGKAYKLLEEYDKFREHNRVFAENNPHSMRVAEAIYNVGWVYRQEGKTDEAKKIYWDAIDRYGNDPEVFSVDELFPALAKLYKADADESYLARLRDLKQDADAAGKKTLAMRALWAQAQFLKKSDPQRANQLLLDAATRADVSKTNPLLLADFATALIDSGKEKEGEQMWHDLVKWNPRAPQKDRALAAMGFMEMKMGNEKRALDYFDRFEKETLGSFLFGKVMLAKAELFTLRGQPDDARKALDSLLANKYATGQDKAQALYRIGELYMKQDQPKLAIPYYQRVYVMYGRWSDWVAKSYLRSGEAFEKISDRDAARRTYQEMVENATLAPLPEYSSARQRLDALGGPLPKAQATPEPAAQG